MIILRSIFLAGLALFFAAQQALCACDVPQAQAHSQTAIEMAHSTPAGHACEQGASSHCRHRVASSRMTRDVRLDSILLRISSRSCSNVILPSMFASKLGSKVVFSPLLDAMASRLDWVNEIVDVDLLGLTLRLVPSGFKSISRKDNACSESRNSSSLRVAPCVLCRDTSGALCVQRWTIRRVLSLCEEKSIVIETGRFFAPRSGALNDVKGGSASAHLTSSRGGKNKATKCPLQADEGSPSWQANLCCPQSREVPTQLREYGGMFRDAPRSVRRSPPFAGLQIALRGESASAYLTSSRGGKNRATKCPLQAVEGSPSWQTKLCCPQSREAPTQLRKYGVMLRDALRAV